MSHENLIEDANRLDIKELASRFVELKKAGKEWHGPCPVCRGGTDRFYVIPNKNVAGCRVCANRWDTVALNAAVKNLSQIDSARELLGVTRTETTKAPILKPAVQVKDTPIDPVKWAEQARALISDAKKNVSLPAPAKYLTSRGISARTAERFHLGFTRDAWDPSIKGVREGIVIPWGDRQRIFAIKYRYIDALGDLRYGSKYGSDPVIFGAHIPKDSKTLVITEGEFNAMAIYESGANCNVVSIGSQRNTAGLEYVRDRIAGEYRYIVGWFDELSAFQTCKELVSPHMTGVISSKLGLDANEYLVTKGAEMLQSVLHAATMSKPGACPLCGGLGRYYHLATELVCPCMTKQRKAA